MPVLQAFSTLLADGSLLFSKTTLILGAKQGGGFAADCTHRHSYRQPDFSINEKAENPPIRGGFSRVATVLEIAERQHFSLGDGIFLQSFVLRHFSIVPKGQGAERQLAAEVSWGSNLSRTSESIEARTELTGAWSILSVTFRLHVRFLDQSRPAAAAMRMSASEPKALLRTDAKSSIPLVLNLVQSAYGKDAIW
jgi:hypothetical protein